MTGSLLSLGKGSQNVPRWMLPRVEALAGKTYYTPSGAIAQFCQGSKSSYDIQGEHAYDRKGELSTAYDGSHTVTNAMLTDWCDPLGSSNPLYTNGATQTMWLSTSATRLNMAVAQTIKRVECTHVSARTWKETVTVEYHHDASYIPFEPVSKDTGLGYIVSISKRVRVITIVAIQSIKATTFSGRYNCIETIEFSGRKAGISQPRYSGIEVFRYSFDALIMTLAPGLAVGDTFLKGALDSYTFQARDRAKLLYKSKDAKIARSNALADTTGLESNWIENLSQIRGTTKAILPLVNGYKALKTGNIVAGKRALIDAYLTYMYVISPGVRDYNDLKDNLGTISKRATTDRFSRERRRGKLEKSLPVLSVLADLAYFCTLDLQLKDNPLAAIGNALEKLGLNPSAANIWDLIPFSFVVDWFTGIGSLLSRLDAYENNALLRDVRSRVETFKVLWPVTADEMANMIGDRYSIASPVSYSWYDRRVLSGIGSYDPFAGQTHDGLSVSQMTQGAALLSSYKK
jgi:hypothetical protein